VNAVGADLRAAQALSSPRCRSLSSARCRQGQARATRGESSAWGQDVRKL